PRCSAATLFPYTTLFRSMPESATVEDVEQLYMEGWKLGLKALAIYRDNCKVGQPLSAGKGDKKEKEVEKQIEYRPVRRRLPKKRDRKSTRLNSSHVKTSY